MHIIIFFTNIGSYHAARLRAVHKACLERQWKFTAVQTTGNHLQHAWGDLRQEITFPIITLTKDIDNSVNNNEVPKLKTATIVNILNQLSPDILALPGWSSQVSREMLKWSQSHEVRTILMSESKSDDAPRRWWQEQLKRWLYMRHFDAALVGSEQHRWYAHQLGMPLDRIFLGYDSVDNQYFEQAAIYARANREAARQRQKNIPIRPYFICLTRFLARKNLLSLITAYYNYRNIINPSEAWDLVICGDGEQLEQIKSAIIKLKLEQAVHLPGFIPYQSLGDWYGLAEALVHPSLIEQWGLVINEACAASLPIICSNTVGARYELVKLDENGLLFNPHNPKDIATALVKMHRFSPERRLEMGCRSKKLVDAFAPEQFAYGFFAAIEAAMSH